MNQYRRNFVKSCILKNGTIADGTLSPPFIGSVLIEDNIIKKIAKGVDTLKEADNILDCAGYIISPGFIDLHTHSDAVPLNETVPVSMIFQGITTQLCGNCGISLFPGSEDKNIDIENYFNKLSLINKNNNSYTIKSIKDYKALIGGKKLSTNYANLIGHGALRAVTMGFELKGPSADEMAAMKALLKQELEAGAYGLSLGLIYPPSAFAGKEELIELAQVLKEYDAILAVHMRNEKGKVFDSVNEMLEICGQTGVHLHISHLKLLGSSVWGRSGELLALIRKARENGLNVTCDQYPYTATSTGLSALVPNWAHDGGISAMLKRLAAPGEKLLEDILAEIKMRGGPERIVIAYANGFPKEIAGENIARIAEALNSPPEKAVCEILTASNGGAQAVYHSISPKDILAIMKERYISVGSDGYDLKYDNAGKPHPRSFGTFPKFLQLVRENNLMPVEDAVYKMTGLPAGIAGFKNRGLLKEGYFADITVFDYKNIKDLSSFENPAVKPSGIIHVFVNGKVSVLGGENTNLPGGVLL